MKTRIDPIKKDIKKTYRRYKGLRFDGTATLQDVASFFDIPIDLGRESDYQIKEINYKIPAITIIDKKMKVRYRSEYTNDAYPIEYKDKMKSFISVTKQSPFGRTTSLSLIDFDHGNAHRPLIEKLTISEGEYRISFTKEDTYDFALCKNSGQKFTIEFGLVVEEFGKRRVQNLLSKIYHRTPEGKDIEQVFTFDLKHRFWNADAQDVYTYYTDKGVAYEINEMFINDHDLESVRTMITGFAIENTSAFEDGIPLPYNLSTALSQDERLYSSKTKAALYFTGLCPNTYNDILKVYKDTLGIHIFHEFDTFENTSENRYEDSFVLPVISPGSISIEEIDNLIEELNARYQNIEFIKAVILALYRFRKKICLNKGLTIDDADTLEPRDFIDMDFSDIERMVEEDFESCITLLEDDFVVATHIFHNTKDKSFHMKKLEPTL